MQYYERIKAIREDKELNQTQVAEILGTTQQQIYKYENGLQEMSVARFKKLCEYFQVSADYILGLDPDLAWPRKERRKRRYTSDCTKYIFLYVKYIPTFRDVKAGLSACFLSILQPSTPTYRKSL